MTNTDQFWRLLKRAMIRGDEVAVNEALKNRTYHECPWKTSAQSLFDFQQVVKDADQHGKDFESMRQGQIDRQIFAEMLPRLQVGQTRNDA